MKIGIIHGFVGGGGGTESTLLAIIEALTEQNLPIVLYTVSKPSISIPGITIKSVLPFNFPFFGLYQRYMESKLVEKAKDNDLLLQASGGIASPLANQQIIIYCHHDFQNETEKSVTKYKGIWSLYYGIYYKMSKKFFDQIKNDNIHLIANSRFTQESIKRKFGKDSTVIHPPVNLSSFMLPDKKEKNVITISRFSQEKNLEFAINVIDEIDTNYTIIGNTKTKINEIYYENLLTKIKNHKQNTNISLLKNISRDKVISNLINAKVYFHASPETFGISVIESIAAGCIPIVPDNSAHKETVPVKELRYDPNDVNDARKKINKALAGDYDDYVKPLQNSLSAYSEETFKKSIIDYIEKLKL